MIIEKIIKINLFATGDIIDSITDSLAGSFQNILGLIILIAPLYLAAYIAVSKSGTMVGRAGGMLNAQVGNRVKSRVAGGVAGVSSRTGGKLKQNGVGVYNRNVSDVWKNRGESRRTSKAKVRTDRGRDARTRQLEGGEKLSILDKQRARAYGASIGDAGRIEKGMNKFGPEASSTEREIAARTARQTEADLKEKEGFATDSINFLLRDKNTEEQTKLLKEIVEGDSDLIGPSVESTNAAIQLMLDKELITELGGIRDRSVDSDLVKSLDEKFNDAKNKGKVRARRADLVGGEDTQLAGSLSSSDLVRQSPKAIEALIAEARTPVTGDKRSEAEINGVLLRNIKAAISGIGDGRLISTDENLEALTLQAAKLDFAIKGESGKSEKEILKRSKEMTPLNRGGVAERANNVKDFTEGVKSKADFDRMNNEKAFSPEFLQGVSNDPEFMRTANQEVINEVNVTLDRIKPPSPKDLVSEIAPLIKGMAKEGNGNNKMHTVLSSKSPEQLKVISKTEIREGVSGSDVMQVNASNIVHQDINNVSKAAGGRQISATEVANAVAEKMKNSPNGIAAGDSISIDGHTTAFTDDQAKILNISGVDYLDKL